MAATLIIVFREVLEAALVVSIALAATRGLVNRALWINAGIAAGLLGALVVAGFAEAIAQALSGMGQEAFNAAVLFVAVLMLGWHNVWMSRHGREMVNELRDVGAAVVRGARPLYAIAIVVGMAVLREGSELVLFLYGIAASGGSNAGNMLSGAALGLASGAAVGAALYLGLLRIPSARLFQVTGWLILLLAAGMAGQCASFLVQADLLPALGEAVWDSSAMISDESVIGQLLRVLIGYTARPYGIQVLFYFITLAGIAWAMKWERKTIGASARLASEQSAAS